jgi:hypothetical protein
MPGPFLLTSASPAGTVPVTDYKSLQVMHLLAIINYLVVFVK